ncbi:MAG: MAPEG family protein [Pseudomonadota bacterium]
MTPELTALALAALVQAGLLAWAALFTNLEVGREATLSDRSGPPLRDQVKPATARLFRAYDNTNEGLLLFAIAVVVVTLGDASSSLTATCAWLFLAARLAYIPCYYFALSPWRSVVWGIGWVATLVMLLTPLFLGQS